MKFVKWGAGTIQCIFIYYVIHCEHKFLMGQKNMLRMGMDMRNELRQSMLFIGMQLYCRKDPYPLNSDKNVPLYKLSAHNGSI